MKKNIFYYIALVAVLFTGITSCQEDDSVSSTGYLRLNIGVNTGVDIQTRAYDPEQLAVEIVNSAGTVVQSWNDYTEIGSDQIALAPGKYTVNASSNGFDGDSGFDKPYYAGSADVTITAKKEVTATITCTLANVEVTVAFDESMSVFASAVSTISSAETGITSLDFVMGEETQPAYFPVADLTATLTVVNTAGDTHTLEYDITGVEARDYYNITYSLAETGTVKKINVTVDTGETVYQYTFNIAFSSTTVLVADDANAWSSFAYLSGYVASTSDVLTTANMKFQYQAADADEDTWEDLEATYSESDETYTAKLTGLTPSTTYNYRMCYVDGEVEYESDAQTFTTEDATVLPNSDMDDWYKSGSTWYPASEDYYNTYGSSFWDTSNTGTSTGIAAVLGAKNPTTGDSDVVHTEGGQSAKLASAYVVIKFAAASLYTGKFGSTSGTTADIYFGQPYTDRPTQFRGWFQYATDVMNHVESMPDGVTLVQNETMDLCSIYIALSKTVKDVNNGDTSTFLDLENDDDIIAYAQMPDDECVSTDGEWKEFTLDLKYKSLTEKPSYIIICFSASKYGDYFTGSDSSVLYVDDLELVYGDDPQTAD